MRSVSVWFLHPNPNPPTYQPNRTFNFSQKWIQYLLKKEADVLFTTEVHLITRRSSRLTYEDSVFVYLP